MSRVRMAKHFGITPYIVFDGDFLPSKGATEASREKRRETSKKAGLELLKAGKPKQAHQELQKAIDVTPEMARHLIEELKKAKANAVTNKAGMLASLLRSSVLIDALNSFLIMIPVNKSPLLHYDGRRRPSKNSID